MKFNPLSSAGIQIKGNLPSGCLNQEGAPDVHGVSGNILLIMLVGFLSNKKKRKKIFEAQEKDTVKGNFPAPDYYFSPFYHNGLCSYNCLLFEVGKQSETCTIKRTSVCGLASVWVSPPQASLLSAKENYRPSL